MQGERYMLRIAAALTALAIGATVVWAQNLEAIKQRREVMRAIAKASSVNFKMSRGDPPFGLATVQSNLKTMQDEISKFKGLFPDDSKTGGGTDADESIWTARADFNKAVDNFVAAVQTAAGGIKDLASLKTEYPKLVKDGCGGCHKETDDGFTLRLSDSFKKLQQPLQ
jgi:cytochrome c556